MRQRARTTEALTADVTLSKERAQGLKTNTGAVGTVIATLPLAAESKGLPPVRFLRTAAQTFTIDPNGTEVIYGADGVSLGAGTAKSLTATGAFCELQSDGTNWYVTDESPTSAALADNAVTTGKIAAGAVETSDIAAAAVTGAKLVGTSMSAGHFVGAAAAGPCTLTGAVVGQRVLVGWNSGDASDHNTAGEGAVSTRAAFVALFETAITVADQIQQASASDLSDEKYTVILIPAAS